jgi:Ca-activated chloride channel family protein
MSFFAPILLVFLIAVPAAVAGYLWLDRRRDRRAAAWAAPALLPNMAGRPPSWRRHLPVAFLLVGAALLLVGFARPTATMTVKKQEATVVLVLDVSGSMAARDSLPTRLAAAKSVALRYVDALPKGYRVSVVTFSDHAAVTASPTHDLTQVRTAIAKAKAGPQGTALADAVVQAVAVGRSVKGAQKDTRPPAVVVLLSDGGQTAGRVTPQQAGAAAKKAGIPVSAVALGTPDGVVLQPLKGGFTERIQVPVQPAALQAIARASGGRFYPGEASVDVKTTYTELGSRVGKTHKTVEVTAATAGGGIVFMLAGALLSGLWFRRFP